MSKPSTARLTRRTSGGSQPSLSGLARPQRSVPRQEAKDRLVEGVRLLEIRQMGGVLQNDEGRAFNALVNGVGHFNGGGGIVRAQPFTR